MPNLCYFGDETNDESQHEAAHRLIDSVSKHKGTDAKTTKRAKERASAALAANTDPRNVFAQIVGALHKQGIQV